MQRDTTHQRKSRSRTWLIVPILLLVAAGTGIIMGAVGFGGMQFTGERLTDKLLFPLGRLLGYLTAGLLVGQIIERLGWAAKLADLVRPLTRWGRLRRESGAAFVACFVSGIVANTMLMGFRQEERITTQELVLTYLVNNGLPIFLVHLPSTFFIVASLAGTAGLYYLGITFVAACLRSLGALAYARMVLPPVQKTSTASSTETVRRKTRNLPSFWSRFGDRLFRIALFTVPIYTLVFLANEAGAFIRLREATAQWIAVDFYPIETASVIVFAVAAEFSSGMATAGALLDAGTLTAKQAALALICGTIVSTPIRAIRHQLPTHTGIFSLKLGSQLLFLSQGLRVTSLILVCIPFALWL